MKRTLRPCYFCGRGPRNAYAPSLWTTRLSQIRMSVKVPVLSTAVMLGSPGLD
jgi:hypothetical protein